MSKNLEMSQYSHSLKDIKLTSTQVNDVFNFRDGKCVGLNRDNYRNIIPNELHAQSEISANIKWGNDRSRASIIIDLYCVAKDCERLYKITLKKEHIVENEELSLCVISTSDKCTHTDKYIRQLRGNERKNVAMQAKSSSVSAVRKAAMENANKELLKKGDMQKIFVKPVIRKAVYELNSRSDKDQYQLFDLFLRANEMPCIHSVEYKSERFNITVLSDEQMRTIASYIKKCADEGTISRVCYDATGGICASPAKDIKNLFHHTLVVSFKVNELDRENALINVGEMISALHTAHQQEIFLRRFVHLASAEIKKDGM